MSRLSVLVAVLASLTACTSEPAVRAPADTSGTDAASADGAADVTDSDLPEVPSTCTAEGCPCDDDSQCDDGNPCTEGEACFEGTCAAGQASACDDANVCTDDSCVLPGGCTHTDNTATCQDGNACTVGDPCVAGACKPGVPEVCDDGNACTDDSCNPTFGCTFVHNQVECIPGNACVEPTHCAYGMCLQVKGKPCDDGIACTYDVCDPVAGCESLPLPAPASCTDGVLRDDRCWKVLKQGGTWAGARQGCHGWGGELASIHDKPEDLFARGLIDGTCGKDATAWLGLTDRAIEGQFRWVDGEKGGFYGFAPGEPNNAGNEDFAAMVPGGKWNDTDGSAATCALCARRIVSACDNPKGCEIGAVCSAGACLPATTTRTCDDGNPCTADACDPGKGCSFQGLPDDVTCGSAGVCSATTCVVSLATEATSCASLLQLDPQAVSGIYTLQGQAGQGKSAPFQTFCEMLGDGGGWTLALKVDGADPESGYDGAVWTSADVSGTVALDTQPGKTLAFSTLTVHELRVGMRVQGVVRWLVLPLQGTSLQALFSAGKPVSTELGAAAWEKLLDPGSVQSNCLLEGLNVVPQGGGRVRVGITGNNEDDCGSDDSWLGLGGGGACGVTKTTGGNVACWYPDHGDANVAAIGYLMVR
jgi:hypothetical protein